MVIKIFYKKWAIWCLRFGTFSNRALHCLFVPLIISQSPSSHSFAVVYEIMTWMIVIHIEITWWYHMGNQHAKLQSYVGVDMGYCIPGRWNESEFCIADDWWEHILLHIQTQNTTSNDIKINKWYGVLPQLAHAILYELTLCQRCFYRRVFFENAGLNLLPRPRFSWWRHQMGTFSGYRWIPRTKASDAELWCFLWSASEQTVE